MAKLEWAPGGGLGRAVIGKVRPLLQRILHSTSSDAFIWSQNIVPMADLVRRDPRMPVRFYSLLIRFLSNSDDLEFKSIQRPRRFPVQMETEYSQPGHRGGSPTLGAVRDLLMITPCFSSSYKILTTT